MPLPPAPALSRLPVWPELAVGAAVGLALLWSFWPTLTGMADRWAHNPQYSHGWLVPLFAGYLLWSRRGRLADGPVRPSWWGLAILAAGLGYRAAGSYAAYAWVAPLALLPCLAGLFVLAGGWRALRWAAPAIAFLVFMMPLPYRLETALAQPLQRAATAVSTYALQTFGFAASAQGNVVRLGDVRLGIVEACSGLAMLVTFFALSTAAALVVRRPPLDRVVLFLAAVPIALVANITRITVTGVLYKTAGQRWGDLVFHDLAGWLMMPLALGLLWAGLRLYDTFLPPPRRRGGSAPPTAPVPGLALGKRAAPPAGGRRRRSSPAKGR